MKNVDGSRDNCPSVGWSLILSLPQLVDGWQADYIFCPVSSLSGSWKKIPTQIYKALYLTNRLRKRERNQQSPQIAGRICSWLCVVGLVPISCHPTDWSPALLQIWNQKLGPQALSSCPAAKEGRQLQPKCLGLRGNSWHKPEGTGSRGAVFTPGVGSSRQAMQCTWKICKLGSVCWSGSFYALDNYFLHKHLMKISERIWCC